MLLSNAVEQCYRAMLRFFPEQMHVRTDGTNEELLTLGTSSYVEQRAQGGSKNQSHLGSKTIAMAAPMADFVTPALVCQGVGVRANMGVC